MQVLNLVNIIVVISKCEEIPAKYVFCKTLFCLNTILLLKSTITTGIQFSSFVFHQFERLIYKGENASPTKTFTIDSQKGTHETISINGCWKEEFRADFLGAKCSFVLSKLSFFISGNRVIRQHSNLQQNSNTFQTYTTQSWWRIIARNNGFTYQKMKGSTIPHVQAMKSNLRRALGMLTLPCGKQTGVRCRATGLA